jgi:hypothetical protein
MISDNDEFLLARRRISLAPGNQTNLNVEPWPQVIVEYHKNISYQISINHKVFKFQSSIQEIFSLKELSNWKPRYITLKVHQNLRVGKVWEVTTLNLCSKKEIISDSKGSITQYFYKFHSSSKLENHKLWDT